MADSDQTAAADVGVVGLAVMGANLARNFARHGHTVALYNRTQARTDALVAAHGEEGTFVPSASVRQPMKPQGSRSAGRSSSTSRSRQLYSGSWSKRRPAR